MFGEQRPCKAFLASLYKLCNVSFTQLNSSGHVCLVGLTSRIHTCCSFCAAHHNVTTPPAGTLTHKVVYYVKVKTGKDSATWVRMHTLALADRWLSLGRFSWVINGQVWQRCGPTVDKDATGMQQTCHWHSVSVHGAVKQTESAEGVVWVVCYNDVWESNIIGYTIWLDVASICLQWVRN